MELQKDTKIILFNLQSLELNGLLGIINKYNKINKRYVINVKTKDGEVKELSIKTENILVVKEYYENLISKHKHNPENPLLENSLVKDFIIYINSNIRQMDKGVRLLIDYKISKYKQNRENLCALEWYLQTKLTKYPIYNVWINNDEWFNINIHNITDKITETSYLSYKENGDMCGVNGGDSLSGAIGILLYLYK